MKITALFILLVFEVSSKSTSEYLFLNICNEQFADFHNSTELWKYKMYDASTKITSGILTNNTSDFGNYDECLQISSNTSIGLIMGKYCLYDMKITNVFNTSIHLRNSLCIPDKCDLPKENEQFSFEESSCQTKITFTEWTPYDISVVLYFIVILILVGVGTIYDIKRKTQENRSKILVAFSLKLNIKSLVKIEKQSGQIECFHGLRTLCTLWILFGHSKETTHLATLKNINEVGKLSSSPEMAIWLAGHWTLQTFFFMSSFLISYSNFCGKYITLTNIPRFYMQRLLRFMLPIYSLYLVYMTILRKFGSGPDWPTSFYYLSGSCKKYWWSFLLFTQNYLNYEWKCIAQTWYINAEIQMFLLSPIILLPANFLRIRNNKCAYIFMIIMVVLSILIPTIFDFKFGYGNIFATHQHFFSFGMGLFMGMFMRDQQIFIIKISKIQKCLIWALLLISLVYLSYHLPSKIYSKDFNISPSPYFVISYFISNLFTCWLVFNCLSEKEGLINRVLSWRGFQPVARLTFSMYLLHMPIFYIYFSIARTPMIFAYTMLFFSFCENLVIIILVSIVWTLTIEMPFTNLQKLLFEKKKIVGNNC